MTIQPQPEDALVMCRHGRPSPDECPKCLADDMYRVSSVADPTPDHIQFKDPCQHGWERSDCVHCSPPRHGTYNGFYPPPSAEPEPDDDSGKYDDLYLPRSALATLPRGEPLIDGVIDRHSLFVIAGRDQSYKSFLALDWLCCLATGKPWLGKHVEQCRVLYVVGEGAWGLDDRVTAWETAYGQHVEDEWFTARRAPVNLFKHSSAFADMATRIRDEHYGVVIFDTLQRMSSGADQNAARDAGVIISALDELRHLTHNGAIGVVAHTDKGDNDTRGSSAFEDDADIVWRMKRDEDEQVVTAMLAKRKDGPDGEAHRLRPESVKGTESLILVLASGLLMGASLKHPARTEDVLRVLSMTIHADTGASISAVSEILGLKGKGTVQKAMNWLLDRGYVRFEDRGRKSNYKITSSGSSMLKEMEESYG